MNICNAIQEKIFVLFSKDQYNLRRIINESKCEDKSSSILFWIDLLNEYQQKPSIFLHIFFARITEENLTEKIELLDDIILCDEPLLILKKLDLKTIKKISKKFFLNSDIRIDLELFFIYAKLKGKIIEKTFNKKNEDMFKKNFDFSIHKIFYFTKENIFYQDKILKFIENDAIFFLKKKKTSKMTFFENLSDFNFKSLIFLLSNIDELDDIELIYSIYKQSKIFSFIYQRFIALHKFNNNIYEKEQIYQKELDIITIFFKQFHDKKNKDDSLEIRRSISDFFLNLKIKKFQTCKNTQISIYDFNKRLKKSNQESYRNNNRYPIISFIDLRRLSYDTFPDSEFHTKDDSYIDEKTINNVSFLNTSLDANNYEETSEVKLYDINNNNKELENTNTEQENKNLNKNKTKRESIFKKLSKHKKS